MSGSITVPGYPDTNRVPGVFASIDASKANTGTINQRGLLIAQMLAAGNAVPGEPVISAGIGDAIAASGAGSTMALAVERYRALDLVGELWTLPIPDAIGATKASGSIVLSGTATAAGTIPLRIDDFLIGCPVNAGDNATTIAANAAAAIGRFASPAGNPLPATAIATSGTLALTRLNAGTVGNQGMISLSFLGTAAGEGQPGSTNVPGVTAVVTQWNGGATDPTIASALANLPEMPFDFIWVPYADTTSLNAVQSFLGDAAGRWNWSVELFGGLFVAKGGSLSTRTTWSTARNDQHSTANGAYLSPSPDWAWSLDYMAAAAVSIRANPIIPIGGLQGGVALNVMAPALANRDIFSERETLLYDGFSTYIVDTAGIVHMDRAITMYQFNAAGTPDNSYLNLNVPYQLMAYIRAVNTLIGSNFNQVGIVSDGSRIPPGAPLTTADLIKKSVIAQYRKIATSGIPGAPVGLVQNPDQFARYAQSENAGGGIVKLLLPVQLGNQLIAVAMNVQFSQP